MGRTDGLPNAGTGTGRDGSVAVSRRGVLRMGALGAGGLAVVVGRLAAGPAAASTGARTLVTVAHADDNLLFMSPDQLTLIHDGAAVQVVYLTTGDAGLGAHHRRQREAGSRAATATMAGVPDEWRRTTVVANGHRLELATLVGRTRLTLVFMRLPDGRTDGTGYADTRYESLIKLWTNRIPTVSSTTGDSYTKDDLTATLGALIGRFGPDTIATQDFLGSIGNGDHSDHLAAGRFTVRAADRRGLAQPPLLGYQGYPVHELSANVSGAELAAKERAFLTYSRYDPDGCRPLAECFTPGLLAATYGSWLARQYVVAEVPAGRSAPRFVSPALASGLGAGRPAG